MPVTMRKIGRLSRVVRPGFREMFISRFRESTLSTRPAVSGEALDALDWYSGFNRFRGVNIERNDAAHREEAYNLLNRMDGFKKNAFVRKVDGKRTIFADRHAATPLHKLGIEELSREVACAIVEEIPMEVWRGEGLGPGHKCYLDMKALHGSDNPKKARSEAFSSVLSTPQYKHNARLRGKRTYAGSNPKPMNEFTLRELQGTLAAWLVSDYVKNFERKLPRE